MKNRDEVDLVRAVARRISHPVIYLRKTWRWKRVIVGIYEIIYYPRIVN